MKIIEALKELPLLEKRIQKNAQLIRQYASEVDFNGNQEFTFGTKEKQSAEVQSLIQASNDLIERRAKLRRALAVTNATVKVKINGIERTITEWIEYRQKGVDLQISAYNSLDITNSNQQLAQRNGQVNVEVGVKSYRFYDEKVKNEKLSELVELKSAIDPQLEIVNATTDLVETV